MCEWCVRKFAVQIIHACTSGNHMPGVVILTYSFFLPSYPLDHVSRLSKKQNARTTKKTAINKGCTRKFVDCQKIVCFQSQNPNIDDFQLLQQQIYPNLLKIWKTHAMHQKNVKNTWNARTTNAFAHSRDQWDAIKCPIPKNWAILFSIAVF